MKKLIFLLSCFVFPVHADSLDEQDLYTIDKTCKIHYLTSKPKNLWTIDVDKNYCKDGTVNGFTTVILKDSLDRQVETLHGFFHQGYWLTNFTGPIKQFHRFSPDDGIQDFIYQTGEDQDLKLTYYLVARTQHIDGQHYSAFTQCSENPILLVAHEPTSDFKQSLFQSAVLKTAQTHFSNLCPNAKRLQILGISPQKPNTDSALFQANIDFKEESVTMTYRTPADTTNIPKPTELRHEAGENILTVHPNTQEHINLTDQNQSQNHNKDTSSKATKKISDLKSAIDLALIAKIKNTPTNGKAIVYVDHMNENQMAVVTFPTQLFLQGQTALSPGWYIIQGSFSYEEKGIIVQLTSAKQCQKEWCFDES